MQTAVIQDFKGQYLFDGLFTSSEAQFVGTYFQQPKARKLNFSTILFTGKERLQDLCDELKTVVSITSDRAL